MAQGRKAVSDMSVVETTLEFGTHLSDAQNARARMGQCYLRLIELLGSKTAAVRHLNDAFPNAKDRLGGTALSAVELGRMADTWRTLGETGIASPDGKYHIDLNDIAVLGLSNQETSALATAVAAERVKVKDVLNEVRRARGGHQEQNSQKVETARDNIRKLVSPPVELSHAEKVAALMQEIQKREKRIETERAEIVRCRRDLEVLQGQVTPVQHIPQAEIIAHVPSAE